jgi:hypothetical protein
MTSLWNFEQPRKNAGPLHLARGATICPLLLFIALSCGPGDLTREKAKAILDKDSHFTPAQSAFHRLANQFGSPRLGVGGRGAVSG